MVMIRVFVFCEPLSVPTIPLLAEGMTKLITKCRFRVSEPLSSTFLNSILIPGNPCCYVRARDKVETDRTNYATLQETTMHDLKYVD